VNDVVHGKRGCISRLTDVDRASVVLEVIDAIGYSTTNGVSSEIVYIDFLWGLAPDATRVLEVADQLFLLGIDAQNRLSHSLMAIPLVNDVFKLAISFRMLLVCSHLDVGTKSIVMLFEQTADHGETHTVRLLMKPFVDITQTAVEPLAATAHWVACRVRHDNVQEHGL
jgi:hypothetical protein